MANYWAIATGINHYQDPRIQPLMFAQRDAQLLIHYWAQDAHFPADQCMLLADISPAVEAGVIAPNRANIEAAIARFLQQELRPNALWWCFSGYGIQVNGVDYLLPIDADLSRIETTAIPVETVFQQLSGGPSKTVVIALDIHRSPGIVNDQAVGTQTIELAHHYGITTFLSCAPHQHSHETLSLRSGLFTAVLMEALRHGNCVTPDQMAHYLTTRLPELSDHLWRPRQDAIAIVPEHQKHALITPTEATAEVPLVWAEESFQANPFVLVQGDGAIAPGSARPAPNVALLSNPRGGSNAGKPMGEVVYRNGPPSEGGNGHQGRSPSPPPATDPSPVPTSDGSDSVFWRRLILWGGLLTLALLAGVLLNNWSELLGPPGEDQPPSRPDETSTSPSANPGLPTDDSPAASQDGVWPPAINPSEPGATADPSTSTAAAFITDPIPLNQALGPGPSPSLEPFTSLEPLPTASTAGAAGAAAPTNPAPAAPIAIPRALTSRNYGEALQRLTQLPSNQRPPEYEDWLQQAAQGTLLQARAAVSRVRAETETNQASDFNMAIQLARRLRPEHPYYRDAQRDIATWSEVIYQLARGRASQPNRGSLETAARNYNAAIAAALLVPADQGEIYREAQASVAQWSQEIYGLAQRQGQAGQFATAIQLARLVPQQTPAYGTAQWAIANWQTQLPAQPR